MSFNGFAAPKVPTKRFKLYIEIPGESASKLELQGRGVSNWTIDQKGNTNKTVDVLEYVDIQRGTPQPTQNITLFVRSDSEFAKIVADADFTGDHSKLNAMNMIHKYEYMDGSSENTCKAKRHKNVFVEIVNFTAEADNYINYNLNLHYTNDFELGTMPKEDGATVTFTPDSAA